MTDRWSEASALLYLTVVLDGRSKARLRSVTVAVCRLGILDKAAFVVLTLFCPLRRQCEHILGLIVFSVLEHCVCICVQVHSGFTDFERLNLWSP